MPAVGLASLVGAGPFSLIRVYKLVWLMAVALASVVAEDESEVPRERLSDRRYVRVLERIRET